MRLWYLSHRRPAKAQASTVCLCPKNGTLGLYGLSIIMVHSYHLSEYEDVSVGMSAKNIAVEYCS